MDDVVDDDTAARLCFVGEAQEEHVEFQRLGADVAQRVERRVSFAEVVDFHMEACVDDVIDHLALRDDGRFRDFDAQFLHRQVIFLDELLQRFCDVKIEEVFRRDVDGEREV